MRAIPLIGGTLGLTFIILIAIFVVTFSGSILITAICNGVLILILGIIEDRRNRNRFK